MGKCILAGHPPANKPVKVATGSITATSGVTQVNLGFKPSFFFIRASGNLDALSASSTAVILGTGDANLSPSWSGAGALSWNYVAKATNSGFQFSSNSGVIFNYVAVGE